jgi:phosphatidylglycerol:prolipoprotein diacylglycerol transferase
MYPEILKIGPFAVRSYGLMLIISVMLGIYYVYRMSKNTKFDFGTLLSIAYILVFGGIIGARLFYVLFHLDEFQGNWLATINPFQSDQFGIAGLNLYGGVIVAVISSFIYLRAKKLPVLSIYDLFAPTIGIGLMFTRVGCFLNGCCFGIPTDLPWGVSFPVDSMPFYVFGSAHLHPAQIYSSLYGMILFLYLHWRLKRKTFDGQIIGMLFMIEAVFRYAIEYVRYYEESMHFPILGMEPTFNHSISIMLFLLGLILYVSQYIKYRSIRKTADK